MTDNDFINQTQELIDGLKATCASHGLGNDGNEYKIIVQSFLYKFVCDKFAYEIKKFIPDSEKEEWEKYLSNLSKDDYDLLIQRLPASSAQLDREHFISYLFKRSTEQDFSKTFDDTLRAIAIKNLDVFSINTDSGSKVYLFEPISQYVVDEGKRNGFCIAIINKLAKFSFEKAFSQKYDYFARIFEYLIKDYNKDGGGKYAEYYTPHAVARVIANILVNKEVRNVKCYDPAAGSGTLLMALSHVVGEDKCSIYSQDISQKSSSMLRLNLILNNLVHSLENVIQGNTMTSPAHGNIKFDYIVSNPPFKLDFSEDRPKIDTEVFKPRFFAGVPSIPKKEKDKMEIYLLFIQHVLWALNSKGSAAIVVPTGFLTAQKGIALEIRKKLVEEKWIRGVISMPSNIFATTGTNVSILVIDKSGCPKPLFIDASNLGKKVKEGKNQKTLLSETEEDEIINTFNNVEVKENFSVSPTFEEIAEKNYSFSAGQYFDVKIEYIDISAEEFEKRMTEHKTALSDMFTESHQLEQDILSNLEKLKFEE